MNHKYADEIINFKPNVTNHICILCVPILLTPPTEGYPNR